MPLPKECILLVDDLISVIKSEYGEVIAYDTDERRLLVVPRESLSVPELNYVLVLDEDGIGNVRDLYGLSDEELATELETTVEELNDSLIDPGRRAQQFPELATALGD